MMDFEEIVNLYIKGSKFDCCKAILAYGPNTFMIELRDAVKHNVVPVGLGFRIATAFVMQTDSLGHIKGAE